MNKSPSLSPKSFRFESMSKLDKLKENRKERKEKRKSISVITGAQIIK